MNVRSVIRRLNRGLERFNDSFGSVAVAASVERSDATASSVAADAVVAVLGEIEKQPGDPDAPQTGG